MSKWALMLMAVVLAGAWLIAGCSHSASEGDNANTRNRTRTAATSNRVSASDQSFLRDAAMGGQAEVQMGQLANQRASSDDVRRYGQRLASDHQRANQELMDLAQRKGVRVDQQLDAEHQRMSDMLSSASGRDFDRMFVQHAIEDHQKDIAKFEQASRNANDPEVRAFAARQLPVLRQHLAQARDIGGQMGLSSGNRQSMRDNNAAPTGDNTVYGNNDEVRYQGKTITGSSSHVTPNADTNSKDIGVNRGLRVTPSDTGNDGGPSGRGSNP